MQYEERVRSMQNVPRFSHGRRMLRSDGGPNRLLYYLFTDHAMAIEFLKDIGLLRRTMQCDSCGRDMTWSVCSKLSDGFLWQCKRRVAGATCNQSASIRLSRLKEIILLTYDIVCRKPANQIENEYCFSDHTVGPSQTGACSAGKPCSCFWRAALLTRPRASSVGESIVGDILLRVSGCLTVLNESLGKHSLFPLRTTANTLMDIIRDCGSNRHFGH